MPRTALLALALALSAPLAAQPTALPPELMEEYQYLVAELGSAQWSARERASRELLAMGARIGPLLARSLAEPASAERAWRLRKVLVDLGLAHLDPNALDQVLRDHLVPLLQDDLTYWDLLEEPEPQPDSDESRLVFDRLANLPPHLNGPLAELLASDSREALRINLAYLLGQRGDAALAPALERATHDESAGVRRLAAYGLGRTRAESAATRLVEMAGSDADASVRTAALLGFLPLRSPHSLGLLIELLPRGGDEGFLANWILERLTGLNMRYQAYRPERRERGAALWRTWYAEHGARCELNSAEPNDSDEDLGAQVQRIQDARTLTERQLGKAESR